MVRDEDPRAPYKVYEGDKQRGTYKTRAEAVGGNRNSKGRSRAAQNRIVTSASRTDTASYVTDRSLRGMRDPLGDFGTTAIGHLFFGPAVSGGLPALAQNAIASAEAFCHCSANFIQN